MPDSTPIDVYPLATEEGLAIPLAAARPKALFVRTLLGDVANFPVELDEASIVSIVVSKPCLLAVTPTFAEVFPVFSESTVIPNMHYLYPDVAYEFVVTGFLKVQAVTGTDNPKVVINILTTWAQMKNATKYGVS